VHDLSGRMALLAGFAAVLIVGVFGYHRVHFLEYPMAGLDAGTLMSSYLVAGIMFEFGIPILCLAAFVFGLPARASWTARFGMASAALALAAYGVYFVRLLDMIDN